MHYTQYNFRRIKLHIMRLRCSGRSGHLQMLSFRVAMVLMCKADVEEKYSSLFIFCRFLSFLSHCAIVIQVDRLYIFVTLVCPDHYSFLDFLKIITLKVSLGVSPPGGKQAPICSKGGGHQAFQITRGIARFSCDSTAFL